MDDFFGISWGWVSAFLIFVSGYPYMRAIYKRELKPGEMLAIPYWVHYQLNKPPRVVRFNTAYAQKKHLSEISFTVKRWSKVEGQDAVVVDGAVVYPPSC